MGFDSFYGRAYAAYNGLDFVAMSNIFVMQFEFSLETIHLTEVAALIPSCPSCLSGEWNLHADLKN